MFQSLLVPLDGTRFSEHALPVAETIARATSGAVHLARVHVANPPDGLLANTQFLYEGVTMEEYDGHARDEERHYLHRMVERVAQEAPVAVDGALLEGDIARRLEDHARAVGADAVVLTTHAREGLARAWAGSVTEALMHATTLPILALRWDLEQPEPPPPQIRTVLVPLDGSPLAEAILAPTMALASALGARVVLMHAVHSGAMGRSRSADALTYLRRVAQPMEDRGLEVRTVVTSHGATAEAICATAREVDADLIALATHGRTGLRKAMLGSVTLDVLHHSERPLLMRRPALA